MIRTDMHVSLIILLVAICLGGIVGAYLQSVLARRGKIVAIHAQLGKVVRLQERILEAVAHLVWGDQDIANLKRETYQKIDSALSQLSSELSLLVQGGVITEVAASDSDEETSLVGRKAIQKQLDDFGDFAIAAQIALSQESVALVMGLQSQAEQLRQLTGEVDAYGFLGDLRSLVDETRKRLLEAARTDVQAVTPSSRKHSAE